MNKKPENILPGDQFRPMEPSLVDEAFDHDDFYFEPKWDGIRLVAHVIKQKDQNACSIRLFTRRLNLRNFQYPEVVESLTRIYRAAGSSFIFDGELIVLDRDRRPSFPLVVKRNRTQNISLQHRYKTELPAYYIIFDLLYAEHCNLFSLPYVTRRKQLEQYSSLLQPESTLALCPSYPVKGSQVFQAMEANKMEGMVAKHKNSSYLPGRKGTEWLKVKCWRRQKFFVGGYRTGAGGQIVLLLGTAVDTGMEYVGAVPYYPGRDKKGNFINTLQPADSPSFQPNSSLPADATWVEPSESVTVRFLDWGSQGQLRHATLDFD